MGTVSNQKPFTRAAIIFSSCLVAIVVFSGASPSYDLKTNVFSVDFSNVDRVKANSCAPTPPLVTRPPKQRAAYIAANPIECKTLCWNSGVCQAGSVGEKALSSLASQLGQQLGQQLLQMLLQGGGGGGGGSAAPYVDPYADYQYNQDAALNDLYNNLNTIDSTGSTSDLYDFFTPSQGPNFDAVTDGGSGGFDGFGSSNDDTTDIGGDTGSQSDFFCPNGDCSFIKDFENPDVVDENTASANDAQNAAQDAASQQPGGDNGSSAGRDSAGHDSVGNFSWSTENASKVESVTVLSPLGRAVQLLTPGDPDRVILGDISSMLGFDSDSNRLTPEQLATRQRAIEEAIRSGQAIVEVQTEDGTFYYSGANADAFSWDGDIASGDYLFYIYLGRWLRVLPYPVVGAEPYLF